jgi:AcrR family transcriptional regulator
MTSLQPPPSASAAPTRRTETQRSAQKRERILEAAREVCESRGYEGTRMEAIAAAAGVSKGTLYNFFESKEQLFADMLMHGYAAFGHLLPPLVDSDLDAETRITGLIDALIENFDALATHILISHQAWSVSLQTQRTRTRVFPALQSFYNDFQNGLEAALRSGVESGRYRADLDVSTFASGFIGMLDGMLYRSGFADEAMREVCGPAGARRAFDWLLAQIQNNATPDQHSASTRQKEKP